MSLLLGRRKEARQAEDADAARRARLLKEAAARSVEPAVIAPNLVSVLREVRLGSNKGRIVVARDRLPTPLSDIVHQSAQRGGAEVVKIGEVLEKPKPDPQAVALIRQAEAAIAEIASAPVHSSTEVLAEQVERVGAFIIRQMAELDAARSAVGRLTGENARLAEENGQMRELLKSLLQAVQADKRRMNETAGRIGQRLTSILPSNMASTSDAADRVMKKAS